jgi:hypothetical protein
MTNTNSMDQILNEVEIKHRIWLESITAGITLLFLKAGILLAIKQHSIFEIGHASGRISLIFILALAIPDAIATNRKKKGLSPLNWFLWLTMSLAIWLLGPLTTYLIVTFF